MMAAHSHTLSLIERLPAVRGSYEENAQLARMSWFRVGGPAEVLFRPADADDLAHFLSAKPADVPLCVIGLAANLLIRDGGVPGVVVRLSRGFADIATEESMVRAGTAALNVNVAIAAGKAGIAGLEFLSGIPGTIGGALRMNAGAFGGEMKDLVVTAGALDTNGAAHELRPAELGFSYRHCAVPEDWIFVETVLRGHADVRTKISHRMSEIRAERRANQPQGIPTGGSTFANPPGAKAWQLIDQAGCRGLRRGGAQVSEKHCNFLVNTGNATAADLEGLGEEIRRRVLETTGVRLEWEIRRIGVTKGPPIEEVEL